MLFDEINESDNVVFPERSKKANEKKKGKGFQLARFTMINVRDDRDVADVLWLLL